MHNVIFLIIFWSAILYLFFFWYKNRKLVILYKKIDDLKSHLIQLGNEIKSAKKQKDELILQIDQYENDLYLLDSGFYHLEYDFENAETYKAELDGIMQRQKEMIKAKFAIKLHDFQKPRSSERIQKLALRAFNGEADALTFEVNFKNINAFIDKLKKIYDQINKILENYSISISPEYLDLKIKQLKLAYEYQFRKNAEKEEQKAIKEQMKEEEKARAEIEKAIQDAEREERKYHDAIKKAKEDLIKAADKEKAAATIARLEAALSEAMSRLEKAKSMAQLTKSGYVYIISNIGSFGDNIYKIGMTRRLEPMDRVNELGDASVPFSFDVHGMIYSENAPELENRIHKILEDKRVNKINKKREFFTVTIEELQEVINKSGYKIELTKMAKAEQYYQTLQIDKELFNL